MEHRHPLAKRTEKLGTETAFAVSLEAERLRSAGQRIYPFHIGDLNFKSPECVISAMNKAIAEGRTGYCAGAGILPLRTRLAEWVSAQREGCNYGPEHVSVQSGGKAVIGKFLAAVMEEGDEVLYPSPGYPIYESQISFLGGVKVPYIFKENEDGFAFDLPYLRSLITKKTRVFIYNNYSNPMGIASSDEEMAELAQMCIEHDLIVLSDEAYFDLVYDNKPPKSIASLPGMQERTVILYTYSKSFAMTGWRLGAAIGPVHIINMINKFNTNDESCTTQFIQYAGIAALSEEGKKYTEDVVKVLAERRETLSKLINDVPGFECHIPQAAFYLFVDVTKAMEKLGITELEQFRRHVLEHTGVAFCTREHFGASLPSDTKKYVRFAYSGIDMADIIECGAVLKAFFSK